MLPQITSPTISPNKSPLDATNFRNVIIEVHLKKKLCEVTSRYDINSHFVWSAMEFIQARQYNHSKQNPLTIIKSNKHLKITSGQQSLPNIISNTVSNTNGNYEKIHS